VEGGGWGGKELLDLMGEMISLKEMGGFWFTLTPTG
jgi:hypothetical protein